MLSSDPIEIGFASYSIIRPTFRNWRTVALCWLVQLFRVVAACRQPVADLQNLQ